MRGRMLWMGMLMLLLIKGPALFALLPTEAEVFQSLELRKQGDYLGYPRAYHEKMTPPQEDATRFIINCLANRSLPTIFMKKNELQSSADLIDPVHPLNLLEFIFINEDTKVWMRHVRSKSWAWAYFVGSIKNCLESEFRADNMLHEYVEEFSASLELTADSVWSFVTGCDWDGLLGLLLAIPRKGNFDRYNCTASVVDWNAAVAGQGRDYEVGPTPSQVADIHYIVTTLADKSLISILTHKSELEAAGARIEMLHPFQFLKVIFLDEKLKVAIRNLRRKGWVWEDFFDGLKSSLIEEKNRGNLSDFHIQDFASAVGLDVNVIYYPIQQGHWGTFFDLLITQIPRKGNYDRYDS